MLTNWLCTRKRSLIASGIVLALAVPLPADASLIWDLSYTGTGIAASGTFPTVWPNRTWQYGMPNPL